MLNLICRGAAGLCVAGLLAFGVAGSAGASPVGVLASAGHTMHGSEVTLAHYYRGHHYRGRRHRGGAFWPDNRFYFGIPAYPYSYNYRCGALHRKALETGSHTWWRRYRACLG